MKSGARIQVVLSLVLLLGVPGCAYYNTFFLARKYYNQALEEEKKNTTGKLSPQASASYDKSITQCAKILKRYAGSKWVDDALFLIGKDYFGKESYVEARRYLNELVIAHPESPFVEEARFWIGRTYLADHEYDRARAEFEALTTANPKFPLTDEILLYTAQSHFEEEDYAAAATGYREMLDRFPKSQQRVRALLGLGDALYQSRDYEAASEAYRSAVLNSREPRVRFDARIKSARCLEEQDRFEEALDNYQAMVSELVTADQMNLIIHGTEPDAANLNAGAAYHGNEENLDQLREVDANGVEVIRNPAAANFPPNTINQNQPYNPVDLTDPRNPASPNYNPNATTSQGLRTGPDYTSGNVGSRQAAAQALAANPLAAELPRVLLREGQVLSQLGRYDESIELLKAIIAAWPRTSESAEALFRIGYIQEVYLEDYDLARVSYDAVRQQGSQSIYTDQAVRRSSGLAQLKALEAADSLRVGGNPREKEAEKEFLAAELAFFQQDKPDKALELYGVVEEKYPESPFAARSAMARAWILTNAMADTAAGRMIYESVVEKYPDTEQYRLVHQILTGEIIPEKPTAADSLLMIQADSLAAVLPLGVIPDSAAMPSPMDSLVSSEPASPIGTQSRLAPEESAGLPRPVSSQKKKAGGDN